MESAKEILLILWCTHTDIFTAYILLYQSVLWKSVNSIKVDVHKYVCIKFLLVFIGLTR